eukprot:15452619-Alexandrium_andersonii.AAC.1
MPVTVVGARGARSRSMRACDYFTSIRTLLRAKPVLAIAVSSCTCALNFRLNLNCWHARFLPSPVPAGVGALHQARWREVRGRPVEHLAQDHTRGAPSGAQAPQGRV